ncbi:WhiB family transcriptional regulator [Streptomyces sp. NPDC053048]|uniref:WhiB family transcriptional regulator n=1 Tax=Streptomyces sp. NPDC053048 TaxID=3365694 RepID=UPI0037CF44A1
MNLAIKITPPPYVPRSEDARLPCTDQPELFFPPDRQEPPAEQAARVTAAKALCFRCPVRVACRDWALEHHEWGVWGGRTEGEQGYRPTTRRLDSRRRVDTEAAAA